LRNEAFLANRASASLATVQSIPDASMAVLGLHVGNGQYSESRSAVRHARWIPSAFGSFRVGLLLGNRLCILDPDVRRLGQA
jgi:hypothetical protein